MSGKILITIFLFFFSIPYVYADQVDDRMNQLIRDNINNPKDTSGTNSIVPLACYALASLYMDTDLATANEFINRIHDTWNVPEGTGTDYTAYFWQHVIWRMYWDPVMNIRLSVTARDGLEDMMWRFINQRSKLSDAQGSVWRIDDSENHDLMRKGAYLLAAEALKDAGAPYGPDRELNDGYTLQQHAEGWTAYFREYFPARAGEGINVEIASPIYSKYTVGVIFNIRDYAQSFALRKSAEDFITLYMADVASDWTLSGARGGAQTRAYKDAYIYTRSPLTSLLWTYGWHEVEQDVYQYQLIPITSSYRVPEILTAIATDNNRPNYLYTSRRFGLGGNWDANRVYTVDFDDGNSHLRRDTYVTPDYTMGTLTLDMNRDYLQLIDQNRAMAVFFATAITDRVVVHGAGQSSDPRTNYREISGVCRTNCMIVQRDPNDHESTATRVFISKGAVWDNRVETDGWFFTRSGGAYCAIKPAGGGYTDSAFTSGTLLILNDMWSPVIIQMGQSADYSNFENFQQEVMNNDFTYESGILNYTSEAGETFTVYANSKTTPLVDGETVDLNPAMVYDSPYLSMVHGEDTATVSYPGFADLKLPGTEGTVDTRETERKKMPETNQFNLTSGGIVINTSHTLTITDLSGRNIARYSSDGYRKYSFSSIINTKGFSSGLYIVCVSTAAKSAVRPVFVW